MTPETFCYRLQGLFEVDETRAQHDETQSRVREVVDALQKKSADPRRARVVLPVDPSKILIC